METYVILEGVNEQGERKQALVSEAVFNFEGCNASDYFVYVNSFKVAPKKIGTVEIEGDTEKLDDNYVST